MADTRRTTDALLTLLADGQAAGSITPQDIRDFLLSFISPHGELSLSASAATTIASAGTYYKAAGTTTLTSGEYLMDMPADNRLRHTGTVSMHFHIAATVSLTCASNNSIIGVALAKNGTALTATKARFKVGTGSDIHSTAVHGMIELAQNDYLEIFVSNETNTGAVTVENMNFFGMGIVEPPS